MAMTHSTSAATRLGCGRDIDDVWAAIDAAPSAHELTCSYCQAARASLSELAAATKEMTADDSANPLLGVTTQAMNHIMTIARTEVRRGRTIPLQQPPADVDGNPTGDPDLNISEHAITAVIRQTSDQVLGLEARRCTVEPADGHLTTPAIAGGGTLSRTAGNYPKPGVIAVALTVSVTRTASIPALIAELRHRITNAVAAQVGVSVSRIDVHVEDVHDA